MMRKFLSILIAVSFFSACGGGSSPDRPNLPGEGGGASSNQGNAARISVDASPRRFDSGDFTTINVRLTRVQSNFMLKLRAHESFRYIEESAMLIPDNPSSLPIKYPVRIAIAHGYYYVIIDVNDYSQFGEEAAGYLSVQLRGRQKITSKVAVDIDRKAITDETEGFFNPATPNFSVLDDVELEVEEDQ